MRNKYGEQLQQLSVDMIEMGALCEDAIRISIEAMMNENQTEAPHYLQNGGDTDQNGTNRRYKEAVRRLEEEIDHKERSIETMCLKLLLFQQPVAGDMRLISSAMKIVSDMKRIGDHALDIAELVEYIRYGDGDLKHHINEMAREASGMVTRSIDSFVKKDFKLAQDVISYDDIVDGWFHRIKHEIAIHISVSLSSEEEQAESYIDMLMAAKYLERIADHAVNIGEWVLYLITGDLGAMQPQQTQEDA